MCRDDLRTLQYFVVFPNEKGPNFHCTGEAASIIQPIDERVSDYIRLQIRKECKTQKDIQCKVAYFVMENIFGGIRQHVLLKKFTIFLKFKFLKKLRYSVIFVLSQPELRMHIDA